MFATQTTPETHNTGTEYGISYDDIMEDRQAREQLAAIKPYEMSSSGGLQGSGHGFSNPNLSEETILRRLSEWNAFANEQVRLRMEIEKQQEQSESLKKMAADAAAAGQAAKDQQSNGGQISSTNAADGDNKHDLGGSNDTNDVPATQQDQEVATLAGDQARESKPKPFAADLLSSRWAVRQPAQTVNNTGAAR